MKRLTLALLGLTAAFARANDIAPPFRLTRWDNGAALTLADCQGRVVVLDFFTCWCVPCVRASADLATGVEDFYAARKGNAHGIPVQVLTVNIAESSTDEMASFMKKTGVRAVWNDADGAVFQQYGGSAMPYVVVIDATGNGPARVVYRHAGFEGAGRIRRAIDHIGGPAPPAPPPVAERPAVTHKLGTDFAALWASDILLADSQLEYRQTRPASELALSVSHSYIGLHYVPEFLGVERESDLADDRFGFQGRGRFMLNERLALTAGGGAYEGYMDYRSLWINEHYRQLFERVAGYRVAHPWGYNASTGLRWEYLPAAGFVQGDFSFQHDVVAPGYDIPVGASLTRLREQYDTATGRLTLENVLTRRLRAQQELQITSTTDRQLRFSLQSSLNAALAPHWVLRLTLSGTTESPRFESWSVGGTLEHDWNDRWFISLLGRFYKDNGQIETALPGNTAAPSLEAAQLGAGIRWQGARCSWKLVAGPYFNRYAAAPALSEFNHLYRTREWFSVQCAFTCEL